MRHVGEHDARSVSLDASSMKGVLTMRFRRGPGELAIDVLIITVAVMIAVLALMGGDGTPPPAWAQQTSCGNAILEPAEQCDPPGSITCPPGSPAGAFLPCNQDCPCGPCVPTPANASP